MKSSLHYMTSLGVERSFISSILEGIILSTCQDSNVAMCTIINYVNI